MADTNEKKISFWSGVKAEFGKIVWTDQKTLGRQTIAVVVISVIICLLITLIDSASLSLIELLIK